MINIVSVQVGYPQKEGNGIEIQSMPFMMGSKTSQVLWKLYNVTEEEVIVNCPEFVEATEEEPAHNIEKTKVDIKVNKIELQSGSIEIPESVHTQWIDDADIEDYVLEQLNLERL